MTARNASVVTSRETSCVGSWETTSSDCATSGTIAADVAARSAGLAIGANAAAVDRQRAAKRERAIVSGGVCGGAER